MKTRGKAWPVLLLTVLFASLVILLFPVVLLLFLFAWLRDKLADRRFRRQYDQQVFFVASRLHDWHEFVINNVMPALPRSMTFVWLERASRSARNRPLPDLLRALLRDRKKPLLVFVTRRAYRIVSLHGRLLEWKPQARRSCCVQAQVRRIVDDARRELQSP